MRTPTIVKTIGLTLGLAAGLASTPAHAGDYLGVSATTTQYHIVNNQKYMCFFVYSPLSSQFMWCLPAADPAALVVGQVVNAAFTRGKAIDVGCNFCQSIPGDAKWKDTMWVPEWAFVTESTNRLQ